MPPVPRPPIVLDPALDDPSIVRRLLVANAPYFPVQRYFANAAEMNALSQTRQASDGPMMVGPVFRGDWAYDRGLVDGVEPILHNPHFVAAARALFGGAIVRPQIVYANLSLPMLCGDGGHTDIPAFRGVDRTRHPVWLLVTMGRSGLFERWRVPIATAVAWYYEGEGGEFTYWPDGPDAAPRMRAPAFNTAVMGDNDIMFHRVESIGGAADDMPRGLTLDAQLCWAGDDCWEVRDDGRTLARQPWRGVRVSVSWKAQVFADQAAFDAYEQHTDDIAAPAVLDMLRDDCAARGRPLPAADDPMHDAAFVRAVSAAYRQSPSVYPWGAA